MKMTKTEILAEIKAQQDIQASNPFISTAWQEASKKLQPLLEQMRQIERLAREFSKVLKEWLPAEDISDIVRLNAMEQDKLVCHSHDFCDANMAMLEATENLFIEDFTDLNEGNSKRSELISLVNNAWDMAKENNFYSGDDQTLAARKMWS